MGKASRAFGEPHINSSKAVPFNTFHLNWQTRISKETSAAFPQDIEGAGPELVDVRQGGWDHFPKGLHHGRNNTSGALSRALGGNSWRTSSPAGPRRTSATAFFFSGTARGACAPCTATASGTQ